MIAAASLWAVRKKAKSQVEPKPTSLLGLWRAGNRRRLAAIFGAYFGLFLIGGIAGSIIMSNAGNKMVIDLVWGSVIGQIALLTAVSVVSSLVRGYLGYRRLRHH